MNQRPRHQIYSVRDLLALKDDPDRWIVENMIPTSGRTLVFGQGGTFKSTIIFDLCVAIASEGLLLRQFSVNKYGPVLLNSTEGSIFDNRDRILTHARAHGINPADMPLYFCQQPFCLDDAVDIELLEGYIKQLKPIMVVLDPLDSFFSGDENSSKETKLLRRAIDMLIDKYRVSFILIHHESKNTKGGSTPRGSTAWYGWADAVLHVKVEHKKVGLPEKMKVVSVESQKQRNGKSGHIFSGVPFIDEQLKQMTFNFYDGTDASGIALTYWKQQCYKVLCGSLVPMTNTMIAEQLSIKAEKISGALSALQADGIATKDAFVNRATNADGTRSRAVAAWRPLKKVSLVDLAEFMVKTEATMEEEQDAELSITPMIPEPVIAEPPGGNQPDTRLLLPAGVPPRPPV